MYLCIFAGYVAAFYFYLIWRMLPIPDGHYTVKHTSQSATFHSAVEEGPQHLASTDVPEKWHD